MTTNQRQPVHGLVFLLVLPLLKYASGYSSGAPPFVCQSMTPNHGVSAQNSASPYVLADSPQQTEDGRVKLILNSQGEEFVGYLIQCRTSAYNNNTIGSFVAIPEDSKTIDCNSNKGSAVTQTNSNRKNLVEVVWEAPFDYEGDVTCLATIVRNKQTFWVGVQSPTFRVKRSNERPTAGISTTLTPISPILSQMRKAEEALYSGCGKTKNCVALPEGCLETQNCTAAVSVIPVGQRYQFDMVAKGSEYVAFAFSDDDTMGADNVVECIHDGANGIKSFRSWNIPNGKGNMREDIQTGFSLVNGSYVDGYIYCRIIHEPLVTIQDIVFDLNSNPYYLLLAAGSRLKPNSVGYHDVKRGASPDARKLSDLRSAVPKDPIYDECDVLKTCFGYPDGCLNDRSCTALVTVKVKGGSYIFELKGKTSGYVAAGLSEDTLMGGDSVMECVYDPNSPSNNVKVFMSWNIPGEKSNTRKGVKQSALNLLNGNYEDGTVYCQFTRDALTVVEDKTFDLTTSTYYLLLVSGSSLNSDRVGFHNLFQSASGQPRKLSDVGALGAASKLYIRLHGAFMLAAWIGFASLGIVLARYYKQTWVGSSHCGKDVWFTWHRFFMVITWLLTIAGFVLIFVEVGAWVQGSSQTHGILGCVTTALCFIQPIMAAFRPHPNASRRPLFNWLHWLVGNAAHIVAIVTIFLAVQLQKADLPEWMDWILVGFVGYYVLLHLVLSCSGCMSERQGAKRVNTFPMKDMHSSRAPLNIDRKRDAPYSGFRRCTLCIHVILIIAVTTVLVLLVVFAPISRQWTMLQNKLNSM